MPDLSILEKRFVSAYVKKHSEKRWYTSSMLAASVVSMAGLVLFVSATSIASRDLSDHILQWILLPGGACGLALIAFGVGLLFLQRKHAEEQKLCAILDKMIEL